MREEIKKHADHEEGNIKPHVRVKLVFSFSIQTKNGIESSRHQTTSSGEDNETLTRGGNLSAGGRGACSKGRPVEGWG